MHSDTPIAIPLRPDTDDPGLMQRCRMLAHLAGTLGRPTSASAIAALGGAAFRVYFFSPDDNHGWRADHPTIRWRQRSLSVDNYGLPEALSAHLGLHARAWPRPTVRDLLTLVRHEQQAGREVVLRTTAQPAQWVRVRELAVDRDSATLALADLQVDNTPPIPAVRLPLQPAEALRAPAEAIAEVVSCRALAEPARPELADTLQRDVLRWAATHHHAPYELVHDEEAFYATGAAAWLRMAALVEEARGDTEAVGFVRTAAREYAVARRAAHDWLDQRAGPDAAAGATAAGEGASLLEALDEPLVADDAGTCRALLQAVSAADRRLAEALGQLAESPRTD